MEEGAEAEAPLEPAIMPRQSFTRSETGDFWGRRSSVGGGASPSLGSSAPPTVGAALATTAKAPSPAAAPGSHHGARPRTAASRPGTAPAAAAVGCASASASASALGHAYTSGYNASPGAAAPQGVGVASPWDIGRAAEAAKVYRAHGTLTLALNT